MYVPVCYFLLIDPPPAKALLLTNEYVAAEIEKHLTDDKYNKELLLDIDGDDKEGFEEAEERRKEKEYVPPTVHEEKQKGKGKKRVSFLLLYFACKRSILIDY